MTPPPAAWHIRYGSTANVDFEFLATVSEDVRLRASRGSIMDEDGLSGATLVWRWQSAADPADASLPVAADFSDIDGQSGPEFTPLQAHVGLYLRACVTYSDDHSGSEELCSSTHANPVANANDAPVASDSSVSLNPNVDSTYTFTADNFPFMDEDGNLLASVIIEGAPSAGMLAYDGTTISAKTTIAAADIGDLVYTPADDAADGDAITFTFNVIDDAATSGNKTSTNGATFTINITVIANQDATGTPTLSYASGNLAAIGVQMTADASEVADGNGIPASGPGALRLHWQENSGTGFADIGGATGTSYTPVAANAGNALRVCARFTDNAGYPEVRCSATTAAVNTPATVSADYGSGNPTPILGRALSATAADVDGIASATFVWQWGRADSMGGPYTDIPATNSASYIPVNDDVGKFLRVTVTFTDDATRAETASWEAADSVNALPTGTMGINFEGASGPFLSSFSSRAGGSYFPAVTTGGGTLADANGGLDVDADGDYNNSSIRFSWQRSSDGGNSWDETVQLHTTATRHPSYIATADDDSAGHIRVCIFYDDDSGHTEGGPRSTEAEREAGTICSAALPVNTPPGGSIAVSDGSGTDFTASGPTEGRAITASAAGLMDADGLGTIAWQWQSAAAPMSGLPADGDYSDLAATTAGFTPGDDDVGRHLRVCASYTDGDGIDERSCYTFAHPVINVNVVATGMPVLVHAESSGTTVGSGGAATGITQGQYLLTGMTTNGGMVADPEHFPATAASIPKDGGRAYSAAPPPAARPGWNHSAHSLTTTPSSMKPMAPSTGSPTPMPRPDTCAPAYSSPTATTPTKAAMPPMKTPA